MSKRPVKENGSSPCVGSANPTPPSKPEDLLNEAPSLYRGMRLPNAVQSKEDFCQ